MSPRENGKKGSLVRLEDKGHLQGAQGVRLFYRRWQAHHPRGVLLFVHGVSEHSGRYQFPVQYFVPRGFTVYAFDHRGHGESPGPRAYAPSLKTLIEDLRHVVSMVNRLEKDRPLFVVGHSFGGQLVLNYGVAYPHSQQGIILSSPNIGLAMPLPRLKELVGRRLAGLLPTFLVSNEIKPSWISRDPAVVRAYEDDPKVTRKISLKFADIILENQRALKDLAPEFKVPVLVMHGGSDKICSPEATRNFYKRIGTRKKTLKIYEGYYHEIFNDVGRDIVFRDMERWLKERI